MAGEDEVAEAGGEALHLSLDALGGVHRGTVRHVAVSPCGVLAAGCPRLIEEGGLGEEHQRPVGHSSVPRMSLRLQYLVQRPHQVYGGGAGALGRPPGHRTGESPVHLERAGAVPEAAQAAHIAR